jgi:hypothetical protein
MLPLLCSKAQHLPQCGQASKLAKLAQVSTTVATLLTPAIQPQAVSESQSLLVQPASFI